MNNILLELIKPLTSAFTSIIATIKRYGKSIVLWGTMLFLSLSMVFYFLHLNDKLLNSFLNTIEERERTVQIDNAKLHEENINNRRELNLKVYNLLNNFFYTHKCVQDVAVMEYHNTHHNLAHNPFIYVSNTFELCKNNDSHFGDIQSKTISLFNVSNILYSNNGYYHSTIGELKRNDGKLYAMVYNIEGAKHIYIREIKKAGNSSISIGAVVVVSNEDYSAALEETLYTLEEKISLYIA